MVAIDSVAALTPKAEIEGEMGDSHVGLQARLMSQALRKLTGTLNRTETICIFTNQLREKIGVMFGNPETTPGGRALKFYASVRLDIRRIETLKDGVEAIGNRVRVKVAKNKVAPPFKQAEFDIIYGEGIPWEGTVLDAGIERKIVQKSGSYFSFGDERLGQGRQNATAFLKEHPDVVQGILQAIQAQIPEGQVVSARLSAQPESTEAAPVEGLEASTAELDAGLDHPGERRRQRPPRSRCATVTALHPERRDRVRVELDGAPWRTLPAAAVVAAGLGVGAVLDRQRARELRRALRRTEALDAAGRALARRDRSPAGLEAVLERRGVAAAERRGGGRDARAARLRRRTALRREPCGGARGPRLRRRGDPLRPRARGRGSGRPPRDALGSLEPEHERAVALVAGGKDDAKTARRLLARGFSPETVEAALGRPRRVIRQSGPTSSGERSA